MGTTKAEAEKDRRARKASLVLEFYAAPDDAEFGQDVIAAVLLCSEATLEKKRTVGGGPSFIRRGGAEVKDVRGRVQVFGARVRYRKRDVLAYLNRDSPVESTAALRAAQAAA